MGLSDVERHRADALAELGYVALAFDLHDGLYLDDPEEMLAHCLPLLADPDRMRGIGHAALDVLRSEPRADPDRIAAVGYGTGGRRYQPRRRFRNSWRSRAHPRAVRTGRPRACLPRPRRTWMRHSHEALRRHFDPETAREIDAFITGRSLPRAYDRALSRDALRRITSSTDQPEPKRP